MKPLILLLVLLVGCREGRAQAPSNKDTFTFKGGVYIDTTSSKGYFYYPYPKTDTVRIMMLCSDTVYVPGMEYFILDDRTDSIKVGNVKNRVPYVFWQFGYVVITYQSTFRFSYTFIDENKKPLPKSIVIWMTKPQILMP